MACLQFTSVVAFLLALLIGFLEVDHDALRPMQKPMMLGLGAFFDSFQDPSTNLQWATDFNGAMLPTEPVRDIPLVASSGAVPRDLAGVYLRVGPNTVHWPPTKRTHVFDGDGMVYSVRLVDGKATFHCDYARTAKFKFEQEEGKEWFIRIGEFWGISGLLKLLTVARWKMKYAGLKPTDLSTANTAISVTPDHKVWALNQAGPPFRLRVLESGAVDSIGSDDLQGTLKESMSAHPKYDYRTKETFFHGVDPQTQRFFVGHIANGVLKEQVDLTAKPHIGQGFNHDMFITEDYVVVIDGAMRFDVVSIMKGSSLWNFDTTQKLRFGVYPRATGKLSSDAFIWVEAPAGEIVHTIGAYNEGGKIYLWASLCLHDPSHHEGVLGGMGLLHVYRFVIDVATRTVEREEVEGGHDFIAEFGRVREDRVAARPRFGYTAAADVDNDWKDFNFTGILKWDFQEKRRAGVIRFPAGLIGGEPIFAPRGDAEDDGYVSMFLWDSSTKNTTFVLYNATTFSSTPVVELPVPWRVPLGFHGWWLGEQDLQRQLAVP